MFIGEKKETVVLASLNRPRKVEEVEETTTEEVEVTQEKLVTA